MLLNKFKTKEVKTRITVGECLKKKREKLGISVKDMGKKLRIKSDYLEDLEENNYKKLPPDVYVKGFIKSYSELVGFNPEKWLSYLKKKKKLKIKLKTKVEKKRNAKNL